MKRLLLILLVICSAEVLCSQSIPKATKSPFFNSDRAPKDCKFNGINLDKVTVQIVDKSNKPDFKVRQVESSEDLTVRFITNSWSSNRCGQWRISNITGHKPDFTVAFVEFGEDFTVRITDD